MVDALPNMQPLRWDYSGSLLSQFENLQRGFVGPGLLRGDHVVEGHVEAAGGLGEKVVVNIGNDGELIACLELAERGDGVRKRRPAGQRVGQ